MSGAQGDQSEISYEDMAAPEQAAMDGVRSDLAMDMVTAPFGGKPDLAGSQAQMQEIQDRAAKKAELAQATQGSTQMIVDPDKVDDLAGFFEGKAVELYDRLFKVRELSAVEAPGSDPTSVQVAEVFRQVGAGDDQAYYDNYLKLIDVFKDTAANLRASAQQTRTDEQNNEDVFRGGLSA